MVQINKTNTDITRYGDLIEDFEPAPLTDNSKVVLEKRYLLKDENDEVIETPNEMFIRVAKALAKPEKDYGVADKKIKQIENLFYQSMASLEFLPNSPTLMNAGTGAGTLSACFVLPLTDSMEGIMKAAHDAAMVQKFGGGTGFSLSEIRPTGTPIATTHGKACGPIAVLKHLSSVSTLVTQGGKRDGANMAVMDVHHPNILDFIECKTIEGQILNFNISVGASDEFMEAVKNGTDYALYVKSNPADEKSERVEAGRLDARKVFEKIVHGAWLNGSRIRVSNRRNIEESVFATGIPFAGREGHKLFLAQLESVMANSAGVRRFGAAALDLAYVAAGRYEGFWEQNLNFWDIAGGIVIVREAGGHISNFNGETSIANGSDIIASNQILHDILKGLISSKNPKIKTNR